MTPNPTTTDARSTNDWDLWIWRGIALELPDKWEMLRFARTVTEGRCSFADRYQLRLELSWRVAPAAPDFQRLTSDYLSQLQKAGHDAAGFTAHHTGPWHGIVGQSKNVTNSRYSRHLPDSQLAVEVVFFWPAGHDPILEEQILGRLRSMPLDAKGHQRWRAFGMDILVSNRLDLTLCRVNPADACMGFTRGNNRDMKQSETFQRLGMTDYWLKVTVDEWLAQQLPGNAQDLRSTNHEATRHRIFRTTARHRRPGVSLIKDRWMKLEAAAWICPSDGRLYAVTRQYLPSELQNTDPVHQTLSCCHHQPLSP